MPSYSVFRGVRRRGFAVLALPVVVASCQLGAGPCLHTFHDPVLTIDVAGAAPVLPIALTQIRINGRLPGPLERLVAEPAFRVRAGGDTLYCDAPCGFGVDEGDYDFVAVEAGFQALPVTVSARYQDFDGGCPSSNEGSTEVHLLRTPEP